MSFRKFTVLAISMFLVGSAYSQIIHPRAQDDSPSSERVESPSEDSVPDASQTSPTQSEPIKTYTIEPSSQPVTESNTETAIATSQTTPTQTEPIKTYTIEPSIQPVTESNTQTVVDSSYQPNPNANPNSNHAVNRFGQHSADSNAQHSKKASGVTVLEPTYDGQIDKSFEFLNHKQLHRRNLRQEEPQTGSKEDHSVKEESTHFRNDFPSIHKLKVKQIPIAMF